MPEPTDPWHPYRSTVEDHLGTCTDDLGALRRSLAGEIAPDRHYFADKAHHLHAAAGRMVRLVQDIDSWLGECTAQTDHVDPDGERYVVGCTLSAGYRGPDESSASCRRPTGSGGTAQPSPPGERLQPHPCITCHPSRPVRRDPGLDRRRSGSPRPRFSTAPVR